MRDIKFRAWRENQKFMLQPHSLIELFTYGELVNPDEVIWMQYTGLKDKNGVEIYEGDIVKWGHIAGFTERNPRVAIVEMEIDLSFVTINLGENNHRFHYGNFIYKNTQAAMEVIGNIHQNPELLEELSE
jgi:uncharacterized phage protein (TIGR01671 family)